MAKHLAARGGVARIEGVQSLPMTGTARAAGGREALVAREIKRPGRIRTEFTVQGLAGIHACDGERGWQVSLLDGEMEPRPMPPEEKVEIDPVLDDARFRMPDGSRYWRVVRSMARVSR